VLFRSIGESVAERAIVGAAEKAADVVLEKAADAKQSKQLNAQIDARVLDITEIQPRRINSVGQAQSAVRQRYDEYNQASESFKSGDLQRSHYLASNLGPSIKAAEAEIDSLIREALAAADKSLAEDLRTIKGQLKSNIERLSNKLLGKIVLQQDALRSDTEDLQSPLNEGDSTTDHKAKLRAEYEKVGQTIKDNGALAGEDAAIEFGILANSYIAGIRQNKAKLEQAGESSPEIKAYIAELNELARYAGQLRTNAAKKAGVDLPKLSISGDRHNAAVSGLLDGVTDKVESLIKAISNSVQKLNTQVREEGVKGAVKYAAGNPIIRDLAVNTAGFAASNLGAEHGVVASLAGDLGGALAARHALNTAIALYEAYKLVIAQTGDTSVKSASKLMKLQSVIVETGRLMNSPEYQRGLGEELFGDTVGFGIGNVAATGLNAVEAISGIPLKGAAVAMTTVPALSRVRNKFFVDQGEPESIGTDTVEGAATGIEQSIPEAEDAAIRLARSIIGTVKSILEIQSPSKVFIRIGQNIVAGLEAGLSDIPQLNDRLTGILSGIDVTDANTITDVTDEIVKRIESGQEDIEIQLDRFDAAISTKVASATSPGSDPSHTAAISNPETFLADTLSPESIIQSLFAPLLNQLAGIEQNKIESEQRQAQAEANRIKAQTDAVRNAEPLSESAAINRISEIERELASNSNSQSNSAPYVAPVADPLYADDVRRLEIENNVKQAQDHIQSFWSKFNENISKLVSSSITRVSAIAQQFNPFESVTTTLSDQVKAVSDSVSALQKESSAELSQLLSNLPSDSSELESKFSSIFEKIDNIISTIDTALPNQKDAAERIASLTNEFNERAEAILSVGGEDAVELVESLFHALQEEIAQIQQEVPDAEETTTTRLRLPPVLDRFRNQGEQPLQDAAISSGSGLLDGAKRAIENIKAEVPFLGSLLNVVQDIGSALFIGRVGAFLGNYIVQLGKESFQAALDLTRLKTALDFATVEGSTKVLAQVTEETNRLGTSFREAAIARQNLEAAATGTSLQPQIQGILTGFQQRFAAQQLAPEAQGGVLRQVGQIIGKSKLQAEDVLQAGENLPGFLQVLARSLGLTTAEVLKAGEAGNLLAEDVLPKLGNQLRLESNESAAAAANSASGEFTRLSNNLQRLKESAGAPVLGVFTQGLRLLNPLLNAVNQNMAQVQLVISALAISIAGRLVASIGSFVINLIGVNQVASAVFSGLVAGAKTLLVALAQQAAAAAALVVIYESLRAVTVGIENPIAKLAKTESDNLDNLIKKQKEYNDLKKGGVAQPKEKEFTTSNPILNFIDGANRAFQDLNKPLIERLREGDLTQKELLNKRFSENNTFAAREALQIKEDVATQLDKGSKTLDLLKLPSGDDLRKKIAEIQAFDDKLAVLRVKRSVAALEGQPQFKLEELDKESGKLNQERSERSNRLFASTRIALLAQEKRLNSTKEELDAVGYFPGKDQQIKEVEALIARNRKALEQSDQIAADIAEKTQTVAADLLKVNAIQDAQKIEFDNSTLKERTNLLEKQRDLLLTNATINNNNLRLEVDTAKANLKRLADSRAAYEAILSKLKSTDRAALTESLGGVDVSKASRSEVNRVKELSQANFIKGFTKDASDALDVRLKILDLTGEQTQASNALVQAQLNEKKGVDQLTDSLSKLTSRYESIDILAARARASFNLGLARSKASLTVGDIGAQEQSARRDIEDNTKLIAKLGESRKEYISELNKFTGADRREIEKVSGKRLEQLDTNDISQLNRDFPLSANQKKALEGRQQIIAITDRITQAQQTSAEASLTLTNLARSTYRNAVTLSRNLDDFKRGVEDFYTGLQKQIRDSITQYKKTLLAIEGIKTQTAFSQLQSGGTADLFAPLLGFIQDIQTQSNQLEQQRLDLANTPFDVAEQQRNLALQTRDLNRQFQDLSLELKLFQESLRGTSKGLFQNNAIKFDRKPIDPNTLQIKKNNALGIGGPTEDTPNIYNPNSAISAINRAAETLGVSAEDIATIIQTESSFRNIRGGSGNAYAGYLQFGRPALQDLQAQGSAKKGTDGLNYSFNEQLELFTKYALLRGYQPGAGVRSLYNTHNLGNPNATGSDGFGTPGGRTDKLNGDSLERQAARRMLSRLAQTGEQIGYSPLTPARIFAPVGGIPTPNFANQSTTANPNEIRGLFGRQDNVIVLPNASASVLQSIGVFGGVSVPGAQPQTPLPSSQDRPPLPGEVGGLFGNPYNRIALPGGVTPSIAQSLNVFGGLQGSAPSRVPDIQRPPLPGEIGGLFGDSRNRIALPGGITPSVAETIRAFGGTNNPPTPQLPTPQPVILPQLPPLSAQGSGVPFVPQLPPPPTATIGSLAPLPVPSLPRFGAGSQAALPPAPNLGSQSILADQIPLQQKSIELSGQAKDLINEIGRLATQNNELKRQEIEIQGRLNDAQNKQKLADLTRQQSRAFQDLNEEIARYGGQVKELNNQSRLPSFASGLAEQVKQVEGSYLDLIKTLTRKQEDLQINLNAANAFASGSLAEFIQLTGVPAEYATQAGEALLKQAPALESAIAKIKEQISSLSPDQAKDLVTRQFTQQTIGDINRVGQGIRQEGFQNQIASLNRRRDPYGAAAVQTQASLDSLSGEFASSTVNLTETLSRIPGLSDEARKALEDLRLAALDLNISPDEFQGFLSRIPADSQASIEAINLLTEAQANYQGKQSEVLATQQTLFGDLTRGAEDAAGSAFSNLLGNFGNLVTGVKSAGDAAREFFLTFLQGLAQVATQIATQQILKSLTGAFGGTGGGAPSVGLGGFGGLIGLFNAGGTVPNYAIGGSVDPMTIANYAGGGRLDSSVDATGLGMAMLQAMQRERAAGGNPVPVVASTGEEILSMKNGDAQAYRSLKQSGQWNNIKVGNYVDGTTPDRPRSGGNGSGRNNIVINENIYLQDASGVRQTEFQRRHKDGVLSRRALERL
jgi:tape measure domain-containing protein